MNVWYINHYATPPSCGPHGRPYYFAMNMKEQEHKVTIICASYHHLRQRPALACDLYNLRDYDGANYYHLPTCYYKGNGLARLLNMLDFSRAIKKLIQRVKRQELPKPEVIIPSSAHPLVFPPAYKLSKILNAKLIYEVRDLWPLSLVELANVPTLHPVVLWFKWIERQAYRKADAVVSLLPNAIEHMIPLGLDKRKFHYIPNGINRKEWEYSYVPLPREHQAVFEQLKEQSKLIVVYTGAHGPPNALDQILDLSRLNQNINKQFHFVLIGEGIEKARLIKRATKDNISFLTFLPKISKEQVIAALKLADVCFVGSSKKKIYKYGTSPNKIGDYFMSSKPVLSALDIGGNNVVQEADAGISVEPYNTKELDDALYRFCAMSKAERDVMGMNGRRYALENLDWKILGRRYAEICESL